MVASIDFIVRRPVFDAEMSTVAYDLVLETSGAGDDAARLIVEGVAGFALPDLLRGSLGFVSVAGSFIASQDLVHMPGIGFDLHPGVVIDSGIADWIRHCGPLDIPVLVHDGHRGGVEAHGLSRSVGWVRLDADQIDPWTLRSSVNAWRDLGVQAVVDGVRSRTQQQVIRRMGVEWFSGSFAYESPVRIAPLSPSRIGLLRLLSALHSPNSSLADIATLVENEPAISYRLLRLLNSAHYGLPRVVSSIKEAVILLGPMQIASWASLIAMAGIEDVPSESMITAVIRGRMCERLAREAGETNTSSYFLVGVLSTLDRMLNLPIDDIVGGLPLDGAIVAGVLQRKGPLGAALTVVTAYESARWEDVRRFDWSVDAVRRSYLEAVAWATSLGSQIAA